MSNFFAIAQKKNKITILLEYINIATRLKNLVAIYLIALLIILQ